MAQTNAGRCRPTLEQGDLLPVLLLTPTLVIVVVVMLIPLCYGIFVSLFNYDIGGPLDGSTFAGFGNYAEMFRDATVWRALLNTVLFSIYATAGDLILGTVIAVLLSRQRPSVAGPLRAIAMMPLLVSPIIVGLIWRYMYDPTSGLLYWILSLFGFGLKQFPGITQSSTALLSVVIAHWWQITPFVILIVTAGLVSIPCELYEAARIDGSGELRTFFKISLPLLMPVYMVILVISGVDTIKVFDIIYALTQGGPANATLSLSIYAYDSAFQMYRMGYAMAISILTMAVSMLLFGVPFVRFNRREA
jgi:multiple sugar transport system permease protein